MPDRDLPLQDYLALAGTELGVSSWFAVEQSRIDAFADVTHDHQFIHVDADAARSTAYGGTIAHGFLTLSLLSAMAQDVLPTPRGTKAAMNFGFNSLRFVAPVPSGGRVRARFTLRAVVERSPGLLQSTLGVIVEVMGAEKPALVAEWLVLHQF